MFSFSWTYNLPAVPSQTPVWETCFNQMRWCRLLVFICNMMDKKQKIWLIQNKWASLAYV